MVIKHRQNNHLIPISALLRSIRAKKHVGKCTTLLLLIRGGGEHSMILRDTHGQ